MSGGLVSLHAHRESSQIGQCPKHVRDLQARIVLARASSHVIESRHPGCPGLLNSADSAKERVALGRPAGNRRSPLFPITAHPDTFELGRVS